MKCLHCFLLASNFRPWYFFHSNLLNCDLKCSNYYYFIAISISAIKEDQARRTIIIIASLLIVLFLAHPVAESLIVTTFRFLVMMMGIFFVLLIFGFVLLARHTIVIVPSCTHSITSEFIFSLFGFILSMHLTIVLLFAYLKPLIHLFSSFLKCPSCIVRSLPYIFASQTPYFIFPFSVSPSLPY